MRMIFKRTKGGFIVGDSFVMWVCSALKDLRYASGIDMQDVCTRLERSDLRKLTLYEEGRPFVIVFDIIKGTTAIINTRTGRTGFSKCGHNPFNYAIGAAVAWCRYCKREVPIW